MTSSRPSSLSAAYSAESDNATTRPEEGHGAGQIASLSPAMSSDTSGANLPSSCTLGDQSPPSLPGQNVGDLGHSRPLAVIFRTGQVFPWRDMRAGAGQAAATLTMAGSTHANACCLLMPSDDDAQIKSGAADNGDFEMPTTALPRASSSSSSAIAWVEGSLVDRRKSGSSILELDSLPNEVLMHVLSYLDVYDLLVTSRVSWSTSLSKVATLVTWSRYP